MKKLILAVALVLSCAGVVRAEDSMFDKFKAVVDKAEPSGGAFFNLKNRSIQGVTSAKLLTQDIKGYEIDGTFSYAVDKTVLVGARTDILEGISRLTGAQLAIPHMSLYVSYNVGYSVEDDQMAHGPIIDATVKF